MGKVKLVEKTIGAIGKVAKKRKKTPKSGNMSDLSSLKTGQINRQGGMKMDKNTHMDGVFRQPKSSKVGELAIRKTSWKSKAKGAYKQASKDIGAFSKTPTGKAVGKGVALATAGEVGYEVGKAKHQNIKTIKIKKA